VVSGIERRAEARRHAVSRWLEHRITGRKTPGIFANVEGLCRCKSACLNSLLRFRRRMGEVIGIINLAADFRAIWDSMGHGSTSAYDFFIALKNGPY
jgi:hypothetical protein